MKPIDVTNSVFSELIQGGFLSVDKTRYIHSLVTTTKMVFCSRPRRFGKSLTIDTIAELFNGKRALFDGLAIEQTGYDFPVHPVLRLDFSGSDATDAPSLEKWLSDMLYDASLLHGVELDESRSLAAKFSQLITLMSRKAQVVIRIDEADKALSDTVGNRALPHMQRVLSSFYQVIKALTAHIRFAFMTGVTNYAKLSVFSGLDTFDDITLDPRYSTMFGYTQKELEENFAPYIESGVRSTGIPRAPFLQKVKAHYNGYRFTVGAERVYNPVSIGLFFNKQYAFVDYWLETGTMKLLMDLARTTDFNVAVDVPSPMSMMSLSSFDILSLNDADVDKLKALLLQTGYLTIEGEEVLKTGQRALSLRFPNVEVTHAFGVNLLGAFTANQPGTTSTFINDLLLAIKGGDTAAMMDSMMIYFGNIAYVLQQGSAKKLERFSGDRQRYERVLIEKNFQSLFASILFLLKQNVRVEEYTNTGRIDMVLEDIEHLYIFGCKLDGDAQNALDQIIEAEYVRKYLDRRGKKAIHLVAVSFSSKSRNIKSWKETIL